MSAKLINLLKVKAVDVESKNINMLIASKAARFEVYNLEFNSLDHQFSLNHKGDKNQQI